MLKKYAPEVVRFYLLNASYRQPLDYNETSLVESGKALERLQNTYDSMKEATAKASGSDDASSLSDKAWKDFEDRMDDDFNTREAIAVMYDFARDANKLWSDGKLSKNGAAHVVNILSRFNGIFDVLKEHPSMRTTIIADMSLDFPDPSASIGGDLSDDDIDKWLQRRETARKKKDFAYADMVRKKLAEVGIEIQDTKDGATWKRR